MEISKVEKEDKEILDIDLYRDVFTALSNTTRLKIMWLLYSIDSKINVSEIIEVLKVNQYNASKHLKILRDAGLIYRKRSGKWNFYYYIDKDDTFYKYIRKAVMSISEDFISEEIYRCKICLNLREGDQWKS